MDPAQSTKPFYKLFRIYDLENKFWGYWPGVDSQAATRCFLKETDPPPNNYSGFFVRNLGNINIDGRKFTPDDQLRIPFKKV